MEPRFDKTQPNLCPCLRWKGMYIWAEEDPTVVPAGDTAFWCSHTQNSLGLDGELAEPGNCHSPGRECYRRELDAIEA
jgi:hypothetical protein